MSRVTGSSPSRTRSLKVEQRVRDRDSVRVCSDVCGNPLLESFQWIHRRPVPSRSAPVHLGRNTTIYGTRHTRNLTFQLGSASRGGVVWGRVQTLLVSDLSQFRPTVPVGGGSRHSLSLPTNRRTRSTAERVLRSLFLRGNWGVMFDSGRWSERGRTTPSKRVGGG